MRRTVTILPLGLLVALLPSPGHAQQPATPLEGSWELVSQHLVYPDTVVDRGATLNRSIKILNSTHFAFGRMTPDEQDSYAGGGRYELVGDSLYIEYVEYHDSPPLVGTKIEFDCRIEDDLWHHSGRIGDFVLEEVWRRID